MFIDNMCENLMSLENNLLLFFEKFRNKYVIGIFYKPTCTFLFWSESVFVSVVAYIHIVGGRNIFAHSVAVKYCFCFFVHITY